MHIGPQNRTQNKVVNRYENIYLSGDLKFNLLAPDQNGNSHFLVLRYTYDLSTLIQVPTDFKSENGTMLHVILTNKPFK